MLPKIYAMDKYEKLEVIETSSEFDEILGIIPSRITRWGISVSIIILFLTFILSNFLSFSDYLAAKFEIYSGEMPFRLTWYKDELDIDYHLVVKSGINVVKGDTLLIKKNNVTNASKYITAPLSGNLSIVRGEENNVIAQTMIITPSISSIEVQIMIPRSRYSEIEKGQQVRLSINEFPAEKYGFLEGKVDKILTEYLESESYRAYVILSKGLITDKGINIPVRYHYSGEAEVVLKGKTILQRILSSS